VVFSLVGDHVLVQGRAAEYAKRHELEPIGTIMAIEPDESAQSGTRVMLRFYREGAPEAPGQVGVAYETDQPFDVADDVIRPLPWMDQGNTTTTDDIERLLPLFIGWGQLAGKDHPLAAKDADFALQLACVGMRPCAPVEREDCAQSLHEPPPDDSRLLAWHDQRRRMLLAITEPPPDASVCRRTVLMHDGRTDTACQREASDPETCLRPVIIDTSLDPESHTLIYALMPLPPSCAVQSAALCAYGVPLLSSYYSSIDWTRTPLYQSAVDSVAANPTYVAAARCGIRVDAVWLYRLLSQLAYRGYRLVSTQLYAADMQPSLGREC
jgi:hypothetical protein